MILFIDNGKKMSEEAVDLVREEKILNGIMKKVRGRRFPFIKKSFYKYEWLR